VGHASYFSEGGWSGGRSASGPGAGNGSLCQPLSYEPFTVMYQWIFWNFQTPFSFTFSFSNGPSVLAVHAAHDERAPPALRAPPIRRDMQHALEDGPFSQLAFLQPEASVREEFADALLADVHALLGELDGGARVVREQLRGLAAHAFAHVVAVRLLESLDRLRVFEQRDLLAQRSQLGLENCHPAVVIDDAAVGDDRVGGNGLRKKTQGEGCGKRAVAGLHGVSCTSRGRGDYRRVAASAPGRGKRSAVRMACAMSHREVFSKQPGRASVLSQQELRREQVPGCAMRCHTSQAVGRVAGE
jgi:hypothetical protein